MGIRRRWLASSLLSAFHAALLLGAGCSAHATPGPAYAEATYVPSHIYLYPHRVYDDRIVYFVNDRWYYRDGRHWMYYRTEPQALRSVRPYEQPAAPARRYAPTGNYYAAPPTHPVASPARPVAPPARPLAPPSADLR
jgi:hypothetical protein